MSTDKFPPGVKPFAERKHPKTICMFDIDGTLSLARQCAKPAMLETLKKLRGFTAVATVGGSDLVKAREQLERPGSGEDLLNNFDYCFAENGLTAFKLGTPLGSNSFIQHVGEEEYKKLCNWILRYFSELDIPIKRGTFIEFRRGMINISPIGRNASNDERNDFEKYDKEHHIRSKMIEALRKDFAHLGLTYSIGGQISFDVFPTGWDKTYALGLVAKEGLFDQIHFFGDKAYQGGNDYEIYSDKRSIGHSVKDPEDTMRQIEELFFNKA